MSATMLFEPRGGVAMKATCESCREVLKFDEEVLCQKCEHHEQEGLWDDQN